MACNGPARQLFRPFTFSPRASQFVCQQCFRPFATSRSAQAGHNKWSKTKHIKAVTDAKKTKERDRHSKLIATATRLYGADIQFNPQLSNAIALAKQASVPKHLIDGAIARGQGKSPTGSALEPFSLEILMPPDIALIVDSETDNKIRTAHELRHTVKNCEGVLGSTQFFFTRRGQTLFSSKDDSLTLSDVLGEAIEHEGTEDVEEVKGERVFKLWTEPSSLMAVTKAVASKLNLDVLESDIVWAPNSDTAVDLDSIETVEALENLLSQLRDHTEVNAIYANIRQGQVSEEQWDRLKSHINV